MMKSQYYMNVFVLILVCFRAAECCFAVVKKSTTADYSFGMSPRRGKRGESMGDYVLSDFVRYRARVAYDGHGFQGFQLQHPSKRTVQGALEEVLCRRCNQEVIRVVAAGRTDTGVHARGQAIHFDLEKKISNKLAFQDDQDLQSLEKSLNKMLQPDIRIWNIQKAPAHVEKTVLEDGDNEITKDFRWNVMYDSTRKLYSYHLSLAPVMEPIERHRRWHPDQQKGCPIDPSYLQKLLKYYEGSHDFRAFAGGIERLEQQTGQEVGTVRIVYNATLVHEYGGNYRMDFLLKGALYKQVRNMVSTAINVCQGKMDEEYFKSLILQNQEKQLKREDNPSKPAPPEGLILENVYFDDDDDQSF